MADNVNEESEYVPGKDELDWGYEEGRLISVCTRWDAERQRRGLCVSSWILNMFEKTLNIKTSCKVSMLSILNAC